MQGANDSALSMFLDWESHFYSALRHQPTNEENRQLLTETLDSPEVKAMLSQRGSTFFCMIVAIVESIEELFDARGSINWRAV